MLFIACWYIWRSCRVSPATKHKYYRRRTKIRPIKNIWFWRSPSTVNKKFDDAHQTATKIQYITLVVNTSERNEIINVLVYDAYRTLDFFTNGLIPDKCFFIETLEKFSFIPFFVCFVLLFMWFTRHTPPEEMIKIYQPKRWYGHVYTFSSVVKPSFLFVIIELRWL